MHPTGRAKLGACDAIAPMWSIRALREKRVSVGSHFTQDFVRKARELIDPSNGSPSKFLLTNLLNFTSTSEREQNKFGVHVMLLNPAGI